MSGCGSASGLFSRRNARSSLPRRRAECVTSASYPSPSAAQWAHVAIGSSSSGGGEREHEALEGLPEQAASAVVGRERELAALAEFVDRARGGLTALRLEGEAGAGKTT